MFSLLGGGLLLIFPLLTFYMFSLLEGKGGTSFYDFIVGVGGGRAAKHTIITSLYVFCDGGRGGCNLSIIGIFYVLFVACVCVGGWGGEGLLIFPLLTF